MQIIFDILKTHTMQMVVLGPGIVIFKKTFKVIQNQQKCQTAKKSKGKNVNMAKNWMHKSWMTTLHLFIITWMTSHKHYNKDLTAYSSSHLACKQMHST